MTTWLIWSTQNFRLTNQDNRSLNYYYYYYYLHNSPYISRWLWWCSHPIQCDNLCTTINMKMFKNIGIKEIQWEFVKNHNVLPQWLMIVVPCFWHFFFRQVERNYIIHGNRDHKVYSYFIYSPITIFRGILEGGWDGYKVYFHKSFGNVSLTTLELFWRKCSWAWKGKLSTMMFWWSSILLGVATTSSIIDQTLELRGKFMRLMLTYSIKIHAQVVHPLRDCGFTRWTQQTFHVFCFGSQWPCWFVWQFIIHFSLKEREIINS